MPRIVDFPILLIMRAAALSFLTDLAINTDCRPSTEMEGMSSAEIFVRERESSEALEIRASAAA